MRAPAPGEGRRLRDPAPRGASGEEAQDPAEAALLAIRFSPIASVITDPRLPDNPIIATNRAFCLLTGYDEHEIVGRNCRFLAGPSTEPWLTEIIRDGTRRKRPVLVEITNYKKGGATFRNAVLVAPLFDGAGELEYFLGSQVELGSDNPAPDAVRRARAVRAVKTLSPRQAQVLHRIAGGRRSKQIAAELGLSEKTVKMHRNLLFLKLGVANVADAIRIAFEAGL